MEYINQKYQEIDNQYQELININTRFCKNIIKKIYGFLKEKNDLFYYEEKYPLQISFKEEKEYELGYAMWITFSIDVKNKSFQVVLNNNTQYNPYGKNHSVIATYSIKSEKDYRADLEEWIIDTFLYELYEKI